MILTPHHAKYFAHDLTRRAASGMDRLSMSLFDAAVDLNPHQIEAALFALQSPLSKGVILADEVGLGKTIEAGIVLCQFWAERKRRLLVICPASLRKQYKGGQPPTLTRRTRSSTSGTSSRCSDLRESLSLDSIPANISCSSLCTVTAR